MEHLLLQYPLSFKQACLPSICSVKGFVLGTEADTNCKLESTAGLLK